jgi:hypothetical protein
MLAERTPVEEKTLNRVAQDETYMKRFYAMLYKREKAKRIAVCNNIGRQASAFRDALLKTCSDSMQKRRKSGGNVAAWIFTIILAGLLIWLNIQTATKFSIEDNAILLSVCMLIIVFGIVRPARKTKNMLKWLQQ